MKLLSKTKLAVFVCTLLSLRLSDAHAQQAFGVVTFPNSGPAAAQSDFLLGLAELHNFEYEHAADYFRKTEKSEPTFAMAYWGEAMTKNHAIWHEQDLAGAREVLARLGKTPEERIGKAPTEREKAYLRSIELLYGEGEKAERDRKYEASMAELHGRFPDDVNGASFYALAILGTAEYGRDFATYMRAAAILEELLPKNLQHPGVLHYLIHCYDDPIHAPLGLRPARLYSRVAPEAGHAQHMTSHIFLALGMWDEVVKANENAVAVVNRQRAAVRKPPRLCGHYNLWLEYGYLQQGRTSEARRVLEACYAEAKEQSRSPANGIGSPDPDTSSIGSYSAMRAHFLIDSRLWDDEVASWDLPAGGDPFSQLAFDYTNAFVSFEKNDFTLVHEFSARMEADRKRGEAWLKEHKEDDPNDFRRIAIINDQIAALLSMQKATGEETVTSLQRIASQEHELPLAFGPPMVPKPTDELLGEVYLRLHSPAAARKSFEADLARAPGRTLAVRGLEAAELQLAALPKGKDADKQSPAAADHVHHH